MKTEKWNQLNEIFHKALDVPENERDSFISKECAEDIELKEEIEKLIASAKSETDFLDSNAIEKIENHISSIENIKNKLIGNYKILEELGQGGMGAVFLAERADEEFEQKVALKIVRNLFANRKLLERFRNERQILALLKHPNISHLIDGGTTKAGVPYFVMEYVAGDTLLTYCDKNKLTTAERLKLFQKICSAVSYAHKNLIIHRDIKPSNILVTKDGTPKLLDFGIAKLFPESNTNEPLTLTQTGNRLLTPDYASPEQVSGNIITTSTDIYSLGIVLYELLTGHHPYKFQNVSPMEMFQIICEKDPDKPSSIITKPLEKHVAKGKTIEISLQTISENRNTQPERLRKKLRGDIDNILLKALAKEPERRYSTVNDLNEDIQRHLQGLPINAYTNTFIYRTNKFVRRNKIATFAAAIVLLSILGALAISFWQTAVARQEKAKAEKRFNQVRKIANTVLFDYHDNVAKLNGSTPLREKMVKDSLEYLDNLSAESKDDVELQLELADAYEKVGDVQGNPFFSNLGDTKGAFVSYEKSLKIRQVALNLKPQTPIILRDLMSSYIKLGNIYWADGENEKSIEVYKKGIEVFNSLKESRQAEPKDNIQHSKIIYFIGQSYSRIGEIDKSLESFRKSLKIYQENKDEPNAKDAIAKAYFKIGDKLNDKKDFSESLKNYQKALSIFRDIASGENNAIHNRLIGLTLSRIAVSQKKQGFLQEALKTLSETISVQKEIADADKKNTQIQTELGTSYSDLGDTFAKLDNKSKALEAFNKSFEIHNKLLETNKRWVDLRKDMAIAKRMYGEFLLKNDEKLKAISAFQDVVEILNTQDLQKENKEEYLIAKEYLTKFK